MSIDISADMLLRFVVAALLGLLVGLERGMKGNRQAHAGSRDFVLFALIGALSAFAAEHYANAWLLLGGFVGVLVFLVSGYWAELRVSNTADRGITTELAGLTTFLLGASVASGNVALVIAFTVLVLVVLSQKLLIGRFQQNVQRYELDAALKLLVITFIVLPFLPQTSLDEYLTFPLGKVVAISAPSRQVELDLVPGQSFNPGQSVRLYGEHGRALGTVEVESATAFVLRGRYRGEELARLAPGLSVRRDLGVPLLAVMASAINPFRLWVIVVLVSFISFVGYVLVKVLGSNAGIGLTGLVGGLASSTVTALSFARRSVENPALNRQFAVAVILASTVMFPRLLLQIAVVNQALMQRMAVPIGIMSLTGFALAAFCFWRSRTQSAQAAALRLTNPFSLAAALKFAAVFALVLVATRVAIAYLGHAWLPLVAVISGLTDADAIAFSLSAAQRSGQISTDWAAFNLVLGAISNTFTKLLLIFVLGDRGLFRHTLLAFLVLAGVGLASIFLYYDPGAL